MVIIYCLAVYFSNLQTFDHGIYIHLMVFDVWQTYCVEPLDNELNDKPVDKPVHMYICTQYLIYWLSKQLTDRQPDRQTDRHTD